MRLGLFVIIAFTAIAGIFSSCKKKFVCSAYYSYYIRDTAEQTKLFSYFGEDSMPKKHVMDNTSINNQGLVAMVSHKKRTKQFNVVERKLIPAQIIHKDSSDATLDSLIQSDPIPGQAPSTPPSPENSTAPDSVNN